ncbi:MAG: DUF1080 domain-containing protein [Planctomycetaceae bacterium]
MTLRFRTVVLPAVTALLLAVPVSPADAQSRRRLAYTDPKTADADFVYQGEFLGVVVEEGRGMQIGLQVVAQGDASYIAVEYAGGLPGTGWDRRNRYKLKGRIRDGVIELNGPRHSFRVVPESAEVLMADGRVIGKLEKVERTSSTLGRKPPKDAVVLFGGTDAGHFTRPRITPDGLLMEGTQTVKSFKDFTLHIEFKLPYMPHARGQGRSNSGVYLQSRYEVQILDSFGLAGKHNECGGLYRQRPPALNMCLPPLLWQTYDIPFTAPTFAADGKKTQHARITVRHNGVLVHDNVELKNKTGAGRPEGPKALPTKLQNHGNPVRFRNIWLVEHRDTKPPPAPSESAGPKTTAAPPIGGAAPSSSGPCVPQYRYRACIPQCRR